MQWVTVPHSSSGGLRQPERGIPLGTTISGALANRHLADFDNVIDGLVGPLVRYADDSVILCDSLDDAVAASEYCSVALSALNLEPNADKSYISNFERGFSYLGWNFVGNGGFQEPGSDWVHPMSVGRSRR